MNQRQITLSLLYGNEGTMTILELERILWDEAGIECAPC